MYHSPETGRVLTFPTATSFCNDLFDEVECVKKYLCHLSSPLTLANVTSYPTNVGLVCDVEMIKTAQNCDENILRTVQWFIFCNG